MFDLGQASGKVSVEYESKGASKVLAEMAAFDRQMKKSGGGKDWSETAKAIGYNTKELSSFVEIQKQYASANKAAIAFEANLKKVRASSAANTIQMARAESLAAVARRSLADMSKVMVQANAKLPEQLAAQGSKNASAFTDSFKTIGIRKGSIAGKAVGLAAGSAVALGITAAVAAAATAAAVSIAAIGYTIQKGFQRTVSIDTASFKLKALGYTTKQVEAIMDSALESVKGTAFGLDEAANAASAALAAGIKPGKELTQYLKDIGDVASVAGSSFGEMAAIFNKMEAGNGKALYEDIKPLQDRGIPILKWLSEETGKTEDAMQKLASNGGVSAETLRKAIQKNIGGAALTMGESFAGAVKNLNAAVSRLGQAFLKPVFGSFTKAITTITEKLDKLGTWMIDNQATVAGWWATMARGAIHAMKAISLFVSSTLDGFADFIDILRPTIGAMAKFYELSDFFKLGGGKQAKELRDMQRGLDGVSNAARKGSKYLKEFDFQGLIDGVDRWEKGFTNAGQIGGSATFGIGAIFDETSEKAVSLAESLEELGVSQDQLADAVEGSEEQWAKFLETLEDKGVPTKIINQVISLRNAFERAGPGANNLNRALNQLSDGTVDASTKSQDLIKALQKLGVLPGEAEDAIASYNKTMRELLDVNNSGINAADAFGQALVINGNQIKTTTENGSELYERLQTVRDQLFGLATATGDAKGAWQTTHENMMRLLSGFGLVGEQAEAIIQNYLMNPHQFEVIFTARNNDEVRNDLLTLFSQIDAANAKGENQVEFRMVVSGDPAAAQKAITDMGGIWKNFDENTGTATVEITPTFKANRAGVEQQFKATADDPIDIPARIENESDVEDIVNQVNGGKPIELKGWFSVDSDPNKITNQVNGGAPVQIPAELILPDGTKLPQSADGTLLLPGGVPLPRSDKPSGATTPTPNSEGAQGNPAIPQIKKWWEFNLFESLDPRKWLDTFVPNGPLSSKPSGTGAAGEGYLDIDSINEYLDGATDKAEDQGQTFVEAFARGIRSSLRVIDLAVLELAQRASDPLGNSPAPYGPLSGSGWTYTRGKKFTTAFAEGISSEQARVDRASLGVAGGAVSPLEESFATWLQDMNEFSGIGRRLLELATSVSDIFLGIAEVAQTISNGKLFPKNYIKDPNAKPSGSNAVGYTGSPPRTSVVPPNAPSNAKGDAVAKAFIDKARSRGWNDEQILAGLGVLNQETGYGTNPRTNDVQTQNGTAGITGVFQQDMSYRKYGDPRDVNNAITGFISEFEKRGGMSEDPWDFAVSGVQKPANVGAGGYWDRSGAGAGNYLREKQRQQALETLNRLSGQTSSLPSSFTTLPQAPVSTAPVQGPGIVPPQDSSLYNYQDLTGAKWVAGKGWVRPDGTVAKPTGTQPKPTTTGTQPKPTTAGGLQLPPGGSQNTNSAIGFLEQFANQMGLTLTSGKRSWAGTSSGKSYHLSGEAGDFAVPGVEVPTANKRQFAEFVRDNFGQYVSELIYSDDAGGVNLNNGKPSDFGAETARAHRNHVHVAIRDEVIKAFSQGGPGLSNLTIPSLSTIADNTGALTNPQFGLSSQIEAMAQQDLLLQEAVGLARTGQGTLEDSNRSLRHLDGLIADQTALGTSDAMARADELGQLRSTIMDRQGLVEGQDTLGMITSFASSASGFASDVFAIVDSTIEAIGATKQISGTLVRGIENSQDINNMIDSFQSYLDLAVSVGQAISSGLGMAAQAVGAAGAAAGGSDMGGTQGAAAALGIASTIAGITSTVISAISATIDLAQEVYAIGTKYMGRAMLNLFGMPNAPDANFLLDTITGQLKIYSSENPDFKTTWNTMGRQLSGKGSNRAGPENTFYIYQGPGQDPRDTMNDAMFAVRSSGVGALGYG